LASYLVVVYGAPLSGKTSVAWQLARTLPGKTAVVSVDQLTGGAIAQPSGDVASELDMVHTQVRLLVANYMKNGYHVVVEGPFYYERDGTMHRYDQDIDQLVSLMRQMTQKALLVQLTAGDALLRERASAAGRDATAAERIAALYKQRYGSRALSFDTGTADVDEIADSIRERLLAEDFT
jgi:chloramphenicol 3-O-phosphotransferase